MKNDLGGGKNLTALVDELSEVSRHLQSVTIVINQWRWTEVYLVLKLYAGIYTTLIIFMIYSYLSKQKATWYWWVIGKDKCVWIANKHPPR